MHIRLLALTIALACGAAVLVGVSSASADEVSPPDPTYGDIRLRDVLILDQENLLNAYRCRFNVDTSVVSVGCVDQAPTRALSIRHTVGHYSIFWDGLIWGNLVSQNRSTCCGTPSSSETSPIVRNASGDFGTPARAGSAPGIA